MEKLKLEDPKISIFINYDDNTTIELFDSKSAKVFAKATLTNEQLAKALSRLHRTECEVEVMNLDLVGKKMEMVSFEFEIEGSLRNSVYKHHLHQTCLKALEDSNMTEWIPDQNYSSQNSFFTKEGKDYARTIIRRWI